MSWSVNLACNSFISILLGKTLPINDVDKLELDLNNDYILISQLKNIGGYMSFKLCGFMEILSSTLIVAKHIDFNKKNTLDMSFDQSLDKSLDKSLHGT